MRIISRSFTIQQDLKKKGNDYISPLGKGDHTPIQAKYNLWITCRSEERLKYNKRSYQDFWSDIRNKVL